MSAQGYPIKQSYFAQGNESAIKLECNGCISAGQSSHYIDIHYFWITDHLKMDNITLHHCPTEAMLADFLIKPLQGALFHKFLCLADIVPIGEMGCPPYVQQVGRWFARNVVAQQTK